MKQLFLVLVCLFSFPVNSFAQSTETFDIATFQAPTGWKKTNKDGVLIFNTSNQQKNTYALIMLYASGESSGNAKSDFESDWQQFIAGQLGVKNKPQLEPAKSVEGWQSITGGAAFESEMGNSAVILNTFSGNGKTFSMAAVFNSQDYLPEIEAFSVSVKLRKPEAKLSQSPASNDATDVVGSWGAASSNQSSYAVSNGLGGYIKKQYTFSPNGTYEFLVKTFQYTMRNLLFTKETGTYQLNGNSLTLIPQKGYIQEWTKAAVVDNTGRRSETDNWGKLVSTRATKLEKITYQISKRYFSGIQEWQLVMQASKQTERDGPFTTNADFPNSWLYGTQKYPIVPPQ